MRFTWMAAATALSVGLVMSAVPASATAPTSATATRVSTGNTCVPVGKSGLYLSKEGDAAFDFASPWTSGLRGGGVSTSVTDPFAISVDGAVAVLPIGEDWDNIELPSGHVCYPGGFKYTNAKTGATYEIRDFWVVFSPLPANTSEFYTYPIINGVRSTQKVTLVNFSTPQGVADIKPKPGGGIGPDDVRLYTNRDFAQQFNKVMGTNIVGGTLFADLAITWKGAPTAQLPDTPATAGLKLIANAIRSGL